MKRLCAKTTAAVLILPIILCGIVALGGGCSDSPSEEGGEGRTAGAATGTAGATTAAADDRIVGTWKVVIPGMEEASSKMPDAAYSSTEKKDGATGVQAAMADALKGMSLTMTFEKDGKLEGVMKAMGNETRHPGTWKLLSRSGDTLAIETVTTTDGKTETKKLTVMFQGPDSAKLSSDDPNEPAMMLERVR